MAAVAVVTVSATACSGFLDQTPYSFPVEENYWKTEDQAEAGVTGTYALLRKTLGERARYNVYGDITGTGLFSSTPNTDWNSISKFQLEKSESSSSIMHTYRNWQSFYQIINQVNRALKFLQEDYTDADFENPARREVLIGELYFLRAYSYFTMYRIWGGVPLITEIPSSWVGAQYTPRALASEVAELIYGDLYEAINRLDWDYATSESPATDKSYKANKAVAYATLAHMAAWDGDYAKCKSACDSIIASGIYTLEPTDEIKQYTENTQDEVIFQMPYNSKDEATGAIATGSSSTSDFYHNFICYPYWGSTSWGSASAEPFMVFVETEIDKLFNDQENDERFKEFFGLSPAGSIVCHKFNNFEEDVDERLHCLNNRILFRLAGIYLLRAEANAQLGNTAAAIEDLNLIRSRSGLGGYDGKAALSRAICDERGRELFLEGHRYFDLCRYYFNTGISLLTNTTAAQMERGKYNWPVDPDLFVNNIVTLQNPYWQGRL